MLSVFICPLGMDEASRGVDGHAYWKCRVVEIRKDSAEVIWLQVRWFYTKGEILSGKWTRIQAGQ